MLIDDMKHHFSNVGKEVSEKRGNGGMWNHVCSPESRVSRDNRLIGLLRGCQWYWGVRHFFTRGKKIIRGWQKKRNAYNGGRRVLCMCGFWMGQHHHSSFIITIIRFRGVILCISQSLAVAHLFLLTPHQNQHTRDRFMPLSWRLFLFFSFAFLSFHQLTWWTRHTTQNIRLPVLLALQVQVPMVPLLLFFQVLQV